MQLAVSCVCVVFLVFFFLRFFLLAQQGSRLVLREVLHQSQVLVCFRTVSLSISRESYDAIFNNSYFYHLMCLTGFIVDLITQYSIASANSLER